MSAGNGKFQLVSMHVWGWGKPIVGIPIFLIGLAGLPDDLNKWAQWINTIMYDPRVLALAEKAVDIAEFVNQWWFRLALVLCGILLIIWPARRFWRIRHRLLYLWRAALSGEVWISEQAAVALVINSDWGVVHAPSYSIMDAFNFGTAGPSGTDVKRRKFKRYCVMTLDAFTEENPDYVRQSATGREFREEKLQCFLQQALDLELVLEFGTLPTGKV